MVKQQFFVDPKSIQWRRFAQTTGYRPPGLISQILEKIPIVKGVIHQKSPVAAIAYAGTFALNLIPLGGALSSVVKELFVAPPTKAQLALTKHYAARWAEQSNNFSSLKGYAVQHYVVTNKPQGKPTVTFGAHLVPRPQFNPEEIRQKLARARAMNKFVGATKFVPSEKFALQARRKQFGEARPANLLFEKIKQPPHVPVRPRR